MIIKRRNKNQAVVLSIKFEINVNINILLDNRSNNVKLFTKNVHLMLSYNRTLVLKKVLGQTKRMSKIRLLIIFSLLKYLK